MTDIDEIKHMLADGAAGGPDDAQPLFFDDIDDALIGAAYRCGMPVTVAAYDRDACIEALMAAGGGSFEEASEHFSFNIEGAWLGEGTPMFVHRLREPGKLSEIERLRAIIWALRMGDCWCGVGIGNPMSGGTHSAACISATKAVTF